MSAFIHDKRKSAFFIIDNEILDCYELSSNAILAYVSICRCANNGKCSFSLDYLSDQVKMGRSTFVRALAELKESELVSVETPVGGKNVYTLLEVTKTVKIKPEDPARCDTTPSLFEPTTRPAAGLPQVQSGTPKKTNTRKLKTSSSLEEENTPSLHKQVQDYIFKAYRNLYSDDPSWNGREGKALSDLISANPKWDFLRFQKLIDSRYASDGVNGERPGVWLPNLSRYMSGPLDAFNRPKFQRRELTATKPKSPSQLMREELAQ